MNTGPIVCSFSKIIVNSEHLTGTKPAENKYVEAQRIGFISYINKEKTKKGPLQFKTNRIAMQAYSGLPKIHEKYYPNDAKRAKSFKVSMLDGPCKDKIIEMDNYFGSIEFRTDVLGWSKKKANQMIYQPLLRKGRTIEEIDEEEDDSTTIAKKKKKLETVLKYGEEPDYIKPVIDLEYNTNSVKTALMVNRGTAESPDLIKVDVETLDELQEYIGYNSENIYLLSPCKIWEKINAEPKLQPTLPDQYIYGITLKVICIDCIPGTGSNTTIKVVKSNPLLSDDEDEVEQAPPPKSKKLAKKDATLPDDEGEDEDSPPPAKSKKTSKKVAPPPDDEEDDDEEEDEVITPPVKGKKVTKKVAPPPDDEEDDDEEEEEVITPPVKGKKTSKKVAPPPDDEEDDEEDDEVIVPPVKGKKVTKKVAPPPDEDDEEEEVIVPPVKAKKTSKKVAPPPLPDDDEEEVIIPPVKAKKTSKKTVKPPVESDEEESDEPMPPKKGKKTK